MKHTIPLVALGLALLALVLLAAGAAAHDPDILVKSDPPDGTVLQQSPTQVSAWFNTELEPEYSTLQVFDINHRQLDNGDGGVDPNDPEHASMVVSLPELPEGVYLVRWTAVAVVDGDLIGGVFTFGVAEGGVAAGQTSTPPAPPPDEEGGVAASNQTSTPPAPPVDQGSGLSPALIAALLGALLLAAVVGLVLFFRRARA